MQSGGAVRQIRLRWKIAEKSVFAYLAKIITVTRAMSLAFAYANRAKRHAELATGLPLLSVGIMRNGPRDLSDADINTRNEKTYMLEARVPTTRTSLVLMCENELAPATERPLIPLQQLWRPWLAHFFDMPRNTWRSPLAGEHAGFRMLRYSRAGYKPPSV